MTERILENWLDKATERSFESVFTATLVAEGYRVLHLTKHRPIEMGKDIIAIAPDGVICVYQLKTAKGGTLTLNQYRASVESQLVSLVEYPPEHPSIPEGARHRSYLVTNGNLAEETIAAIRLQNDSYLRRRTKFRLHTILRGELLEKINGLTAVLVPKELADVRKFLSLLLDIYLSNACDVVAQDKLCELLNTVFAVDRPRIGRTQATRRAAAAAVIVAAITSEYERAKNYQAIIDTWKTYLSFVCRTAEEKGLKSRLTPEIDISLAQIASAQQALTKEALKSKVLREGDFLFDNQVLPYRVTSVLGAAATQMLLVGRIEPKHLIALMERHPRYFGLWGEAALPYILPLMWIVGDYEPLLGKQILLSLLKQICLRNNPYSKLPVPNAYYSAQSLLRSSFGLDKPITDNFAGLSMALQPLLGMAVRRGMKLELKEMWRWISHIRPRSIAIEGAGRYSWRSEAAVDSQGSFGTEMAWHTLVEMADYIPPDIRNLEMKDPLLLLLNAQAFPHRLSPGLSNYLDREFGRKQFIRLPCECEQCGAAGPVSLLSEGG